MSRIDHVVVADERDPESEGMRLGRRARDRYGTVLHRHRRRQRTVYTSYLKLLKEVCR